ncbi:MAG: hypothetical protein QF714_10040 [Dehalococcoidia bacterium]|jgi:hypothetical protein|nr:hypothetical protein [Dehalococcoidia bacterium]
MWKWLIKDLFLVGGLLMMAALSAVGAIGSALNIEYLREHDWLGLSLGEWVFYVLGVSFWAVVCRLLVRLRSLEVAGPSIVVTLFPEGAYQRLKVVNEGGAAEFRADARVVEPETSHVSPWWVKWRSTYLRTQRIHSGDSAILDIASIGATLGIPGTGAKYCQVIRCHTARQEIEPDSGEDHQYVDHFDLYEDEKKVLIEITLKSEPKLLKGFCARYSIELLEQGLIKMEELVR